ncbi:hypothetical protein F5144DRAFT_201576 [Chaetomium tenue]|uniref:Uncharacterized protein n=1 Tax=Chaetomium tenue TaxID=1854479 RepID=A0ACB7PDH2_9PEZI|nr:hypothetical protein F5144DRAFT_201576 [Chaetomium globosum]
MLVVACSPVVGLGCAVWWLFTGPASLTSTDANNGGHDESRHNYTINDLHGGNNPLFLGDWTFRPLQMMMLFIPCRNLPKTTDTSQGFCCLVTLDATWYVTPRRDTDILESSLTAAGWLNPSCRAGSKLQRQITAVGSKILAQNFNMSEPTFLSQRGTTWQYQGCTS